MDYPNITLKVKNQVPMIELHQDEHTSKRIAESDEGFDTVLMETAEKLGFDHQSDLDIIMDLVGEGDEQLVKFDELDFTNSEMSFANLKQQILDYHAESSIPVEVKTEELKEQLTEYLHADLLASLLEEMYNSLIGRTFYLAAEMAITTIVLDDDRHDTRLQEKMGKELGLVEEIDFIVL